MSEQRSMPVAGRMPANQRADARRNRDRIIEAAVDCFGRNPDALVAEVAKQAGVGRVTLYSHFATRAELVAAAVQRAMDVGETEWSRVELNGDPVAALTRLIDSSWESTERSRALLAVAEKVLPQERIHDLHARPAERVLELITRGQAEGAFRTDLPAVWLVSTLHSVLHGAAAEVDAGRLDAADAAGYITAVVLPAFTAARD